MIDFTAFSHGQVESKLWLCNQLEPIINKNFSTPVNISVLGGWYAVLPFMLFVRDRIQIGQISSYDIDKKVERIADNINNAWVCDNWKFKSYTGDANSVNLESFDVVINTSAEHILDKSWFENLNDQLIVIQSTDQIHDDDDPHDYCFSLDQLISMYPMNRVYQGEKKFSYPDKEFTRYMIIGFKQP